MTLNEPLSTKITTLIGKLRFHGPRIYIDNINISMPNSPAKTRYLWPGDDHRDRGKWCLLDLHVAGIFTCRTCTYSSTEHMAVSGRVEDLEASELPLQAPGGEES